MTDTTSQTRAGFAAIIGAPNAGKSTLVNRMVGAKVSIVTQKVQTTRFPVRGVAIEGDTQIVLVDTPGIFSPRRRLDRAMVRAAWAGSEDAEATVHLVDVQAELSSRADKATPGEYRSVQDVQTIIEGLKAANRKVILALNKIDGVKRDTLLLVAKEFFDTGVYTDVFMISASTGAGVEDLTAKLVTMMPEAPGSIRKTRPPTCRPACWPPRSPAKRSICASTKSCPTPPWSRPRPSRSARTAASASSRPSWSSARASGSS
jgi:GTP-binding protein Era